MFSTLGEYSKGLGVLLGVPSILVYLPAKKAFGEGFAYDEASKIWLYEPGPGVGPPFLLFRLSTLPFLEVCFIVQLAWCFLTALMLGR